MKDKVKLITFPKQDTEVAHDELRSNLEADDLPAFDGSRGGNFSRAIYLSGHHSFCDIWEDI